MLGKITVIKSLAVSQLLYLLSPLRSNYRILNEINDLLYTFLWNGKGDKIKRKTMINDLSVGGLKMIDISSFNKSLKTTWIKKYLDNNNKGKWKIFFDIALKNYGCQNVFSYNLNVRDTSSTIATSDAFVNELLEIYCKFKRSVSAPKCRFSSMAPGADLTPRGANLSIWSISTPIKTISAPPKTVSAQGVQ